MSTAEHQRKGARTDVVHQHALGRRPVFPQQGQQAAGVPFLVPLRGVHQHRDAQPPGQPQLLHHRLLLRRPAVVQPNLPQGHHPPVVEGRRQQVEHGLQPAAG